MCALVDMVSLDDTCISVPEMRTILTLSGLRAMDEGHRNRQLVPVSRA